MSIQSLPFAGFCLAILILYYLLPRAKQNLLLLAASYFFCAAISWRFALILLLMTSVTYLCGLRLSARGRARRWLWTGIGINLLAWLYFKAAAFFAPQWLALLSRAGLAERDQGLGMVLPIGISFYTLQAISYLAEAYRGRIEPMPICSDFALYLAYFPKLTAGPIERPGAFLSQLARARRVDNGTLARSSMLVMLGLTRKLVIADPLLAALPESIFTAPAGFSAIELIAWLAAYAFGIYNNFCGYTDIMRGVSGFFGITLSANFARPFFSRSFKELWNRWHITLSHWLRDYIYFPISRSLLKRDPGITNRANIILPPLLTMLASGLWHGPALHYLAWGLLLGVFLAAENIRAATRPVRRPDDAPWWRQRLANARVMLLALAASAFFAMDLSVVKPFFSAIFIGPRWALPSSRVFLLMLPSLWIDLVQHRRGDEFAFLSWPRPARVLLLAFAVLAVFLFAQGGTAEPFIYQGF
jgi:D-alanyl-lipoteichoic acid acyltransferase DltB (MBOAT superfamily)